MKVYDKPVVWPVKDKNGDSIGTIRSKVQPTEFEYELHRRRILGPPYRLSDFEGAAEDQLDALGCQHAPVE